MAYSVITHTMIIVCDPSGRATNYIRIVELLLMVNYDKFSFF